MAFFAHRSVIPPLTPFSHHLLFCVCLFFLLSCLLEGCVLVDLGPTQLIDDGLILIIFCIVKYAKTLFTNKTTFTGSRGTKLLGATSRPAASSYRIIILSCCASPKLPSLYFFLGTNFFLFQSLPCRLPFFSLLYGVRLTLIHLCHFTFEVSFSRQLSLLSLNYSLQGRLELHSCNTSSQYHILILAALNTIII